LLRFDKDWKVIPEGHLPLRDSYFSPERVLYEGGIEPLLRGFVYQPAQEIDTKVINAL
jgi:peroxidase